jgi:hypothetical protein
MLRTLSILALAALLAGCSKKPATESATPAREDAAPASVQAPATPPAETGGAQRGTVVETMNAAEYTYVRVKTAQGEIWAAGPQTTVAVGDQVELAAGMLMQQFQSKSLNRTFDQIYFVNEIRTAGQGHTADKPAGHPETEDPLPGREHTVVTGQTVAAGSIARATGGRTIAEMRAGRAGLGGQQIQVRGKVVKVNNGIMGHNWLHIQDGSAEGATGDLTVTTDATAKVGDVVLITGTVAVDRDFGAGYRYDLIVEDASLTVETH